MHHISWSTYEFVCFCFSFLLLLFAGFCSRFRLVKGQFLWILSWLQVTLHFGEGCRQVTGRTVLADHDQPCVLLCVCFLTLGPVADGTSVWSLEASGTLTQNSWPHVHGKWSCWNLQSQAPVTCLDFSDGDKISSSRAKNSRKRITMCLSAM